MPRRAFSRSRLLLRRPLSRRLLSRRAVLIGAGVGLGTGGALVIGTALVPRHYRSPLQPGRRELAIDSLIRLSPGGTVSVVVPATEMGQGVTTIVAQIVATELGADWRRIGVELAPLSPVYADPVITAAWATMWLPRGVAGAPGIGDDLASVLAGAPGDALVRYEADTVPMLLTACGTTLAAFEPRLRLAAAALRSVLIAAAARIGGVPVTACDTFDHQVRCGAQRWDFAALVEPARATPLPRVPVLRNTPAHEPGDAPSATAPAAPAFPRLDLPAKVDGSLVFAADIRLPGMVHAAIAHGPQGPCRLTSHDPGAAQRIPGVIAVVAAPTWLAAIAQTWHAADRAVAAMEPRFRAEPGQGGRVADTAIDDAALDAALDGRGRPATRIAAQGNPDPLLGAGSLVARYDIAPALHAPLELASATARLRNGRLELWIATQAPEAAAWAAARGAGVARDAVTVYALAAGGSFDARLDTRIAEEVAVLARETGRPVQLTWSRWQETLAGYPRAPVRARISAAFDPANHHLIGWRALLATPASMIEAGTRLFAGNNAPAAQAHAAGRADPLALTGAMPVYAIPERAVDHAPAAISLPVGRMRGGGDAIGAFITECFIDECAHFTGSEPLLFRVGMLGGEPRLVATLEGVGQLATWGSGPGQGLACHRMTLIAPEGPRMGTIAVVASARIDAGAIRVDSLAAYCDIGRIVNRDIAHQQIEGGLMFGLALALGSSSRWSAGLPAAGRLAALNLPLLGDCPKVTVAFAASDAEPFDPGELGVVAVAPAIANALFSASGTRFRRLPLSPSPPFPESP